MSVLLPSYISAMDIFRGAEKLMGMTDATWARHANPWSVLTRFTCLPLLVIALWSHVWLGWSALVPIGAALAWIWLNPRAFPEPESIDTWAGKATLGERVYLNRKAVPVPLHHARAAGVLTALSGLGGLVLIWGLVTLNPTVTVSGTVLTMAFKAWFCDRMVWLFEDMDADGVTLKSPSTRAPQA